MQQQSSGKYGRSRGARKRATIVGALMASLLIGGVALASDNGWPSRSEDDSVASSSESQGTGKSSSQDWGRRPTPHPDRGGRRPDLTSPTATVVTPSPTPTDSPSPTETEPEETESPSESEEPSPPPTEDETDEPDDDREDPGHTGDFPTMDSTGPRISASEMKESGAITSEANGQVIEGLKVQSQVKIIHDDVTVKDVSITFDGGNYGLHIAQKNDGTCPENVVLDHVEVVGRNNQIDDEGIAVYSSCPYTLRNSRVHDVGSAVRVTNGTVIENNYIHANHFLPGSSAHRSAIGLNGGRDHVISGNTVDCGGHGCSGALVMYGDFAQVTNVLVENNLFNTTGSYCTYAGSVPSKEYPSASNVRYIGNHFGRKYFDTCGRYGPVTARNDATIWESNIWSDTGASVE